MLEEEKLATLIRKLNESGHNPATSGNYSLRHELASEYVLVSESGIDKSQFLEKNFLPVSLKTKKVKEEPVFAGRKPSDETALHLCIFQNTNAHCVLHSHLLESLLFANLYPNKDHVYFEGMELLKGFKGIKTHEVKVPVLFFENTQDIDELSVRVAKKLIEFPQTFGIILRHHGLYAWGDSVASAKRHLEVFEYLFNYYLRSGVELS